jgi:PAS domain S-box-containing protein
MAALALCHPLLWHEEQPDLCFAPLGMGLALTAWLGFRIVPLVALELALIQLWFGPASTAPLQMSANAVLSGVEIALAWWLYRVRADGARRLDDPRSATVFLLLVPGLVAGSFAVLQVFANHGVASGADLGALVLQVWMGRALGVVAVAPALLVLATPWLVHYRLADADPAEKKYPLHPSQAWTTGEVLEIANLSFAAAVLGVALALLHAQSLSTNWHLWGVLLLVIVWASLRLGLRGGTAAAALASVLGIAVGAAATTDPAFLAPLRGNLLAQGCTALLIGASADWIRASEARYRQVVGHIPVVLYSARFLGKPAQGLLPDIEIVLVSPAARNILGCAPEDLVGSYQRWLERIHPSDRELVRAALAQLLLQKQPVTCEYRLASDHAQPDAGTAFKFPPNALQNLPRHAGAELPWLRDTLAPHYSADGQLNGWEGVVEDISERRILAHDLRRTTNMLQALVAHLPTGVYFVHGATGQPLLVNARARQLLGQREDLAAGLSRLSSVYRLHRADGQPYPSEELPVSKALRSGTTSMRDDIVVHRPDGRRVPLVTWAAPVNLGNHGEADAAVWVLEDLTALRQAEAARQETEMRLRVVIETMAEGLLVQNHTGAVVECNAAACAILGADADQLRSRTSLGADGVAFYEDGRPMPRDEQPDRRSLRTGEPARGVIIGIPAANRLAADAKLPAADGRAIRWILANSMPITVSDKVGDTRGQRVVTTFTDITAHRRALEILRQSEEQYRELVETLPLMLLQFDQEGALIYHNPAAEEISGFGGADLRQPGFWQTRVHGDDWPAFAAVLEAARAGQVHRGEFRYQAADGAEKVGYALGQPRQGAGATLLVVDMTQRRRMEQELQKVQRLELVARIAGGVVHDFNNWLAVIASYADLIKVTLGNHPVRADLDRVSEAADQAARVAAQLLAFSKERQVVMRRVDLNTAVQRALDMLQPTLPFNINVAVEVGAVPLWVLADDAPLQQVLMNLCLNARDAMPAGGHLQVATSTEHLPPGDDRVAAAAAATGGVRTWARLTVTDTGCGINDTVKARIFEPLFTTKERGSGLGLAVVQQIVQGLGGCIHVHSNPGQGSRFDVWLPEATC